MKDSYPKDFTTVGEPGRLVALTNRAATQLADDATILGSIGDDHRFESTKWESSFIKGLDKLGGIGVMYGDDGLQGQNLATAFFISANIVRQLGYMIWPELEHLYADNYAMELGKVIDKLLYMPNVKITHYHPLAGKSPWDLTYDIGNNDGVWVRDRAAFEHWYNNHRQDLKCLLSN